MDMINLQDREHAAPDAFAHLPNDVLLSILSRLDDLKHLCHSSLVCKRFATAICGISSVSITLPSITMNSSKCDADLTELFPVILDWTSEEIISFIESSSIRELKFLLFLHKFRDLKFISLVFMCPTIFCNPPFFKWKFKSRSSGEMAESIVSLLADSVHEMPENEPEEQHGGIEAPYLFPLSHIKCSVFYPLRCCKEWLFVLYLLLKCHPSLESVAITNSKKEAVLVLRDEQLIEWRTKLLHGELSSPSYPENMKMAWLRELRLPLSGCLLKRVCFIVMIFPTESGANIEDDTMTWEYEGEDKLLGEAVREMLTTHRDNLTALCFNPFIGADDDRD